MSKNKRQSDDVVINGIVPCEGLPVQYHTVNGPLAAFLERRCFTDASKWDVRVWVSGAYNPVVHTDVEQAFEPTPGCWTMLPGFGG